MAYIEEINLINSDGKTINPATDEMIRKLITLLGPLSTQDTAQRLRITLDAITGSLTLSTITTVSTVTSVSQFAGVDLRYYLADNARNMYANSIRPYMSFS